MIIERNHKSIIEEQNIYSFELIYSHGLVSGITSLSMFLMMRPESLLLAWLGESLDLKICLSFFTNGA